MPVYRDLESLRCDSAGSAVKQYEVTFEPLPPQICTGTPPASANRTTCIQCPFGLVLQGGTCKPCPANTYALQGMCSLVDKSHATIAEAAFFHVGDVRAALPAQWNTKCYGEGCATSG